MENSPKAYQGNGNYVFISYAHKDKSRVFPAIEAMQKAGYNVWYDEGIEAGTEWPTYIANKLKGSSLVFAFVSRNSIMSDNCTEEIYFARANKKKLLIIYLEAVVLPSGLEMRLSLMQSLFAYKHSNNQSFLEELVTAKIVKESLVPSAQKPLPVKPIVLSKEDEEKKKFNEAVKLFKSDVMDEAVERFMEIGTNDAHMYVFSVAYKYFQKKEYDNAIKVLVRIENYKSGTSSAKELIKKCKEGILDREREEVLTQARGLINRGVYDSAVEKLLPLIEYKPGVAEMICEVANKYYSMHKYDQGLEIYRALLKKTVLVDFFGKNKAKERLYYKAQEYKEQWKKDKSEETLRKAAEDFSLARGHLRSLDEAEEIYDKLAISAYKNGDFEKAIEYFLSVGYTKNKEKYMEKLTKGYDFDYSWTHLCGVTNRKKSYVLPSHVARICKSAFNGDEVITEITGNAKLMGMERESFEWCVSLKTVDLSKTKIQKLEEYTFAYCKNLTTVIMPKAGDPKLVNDTVFYQCDNLKTIITSSGKKMPLEDYIITYLE